MNKKFLQSVAAGVVGLSLIASCSQLSGKKESHNCGAKNGCASKKKEEAATKEVKKDSKVEKKAKKAKKAEAAKSEVK